jgi:hypothetical protein
MKHPSLTVNYNILINDDCTTLHYTSGMSTSSVTTLPSKKLKKSPYFFYFILVYSCCIPGHWPVPQEVWIPERLGMMVEDRRFLGTQLIG